MDLSDRFSWLDLSIPSGIVGLYERSIDLVYPFHMTLWKKESFSLLVLDEAHLGPDGVIQNELYVCLRRPKGLEFGKDMWREASNNAP